jgi:hypothetical protein
MKRIMIVLSLIIAAAAVSRSYGATVIESRDGQGENQKIWIEGSKMRVESGSELSYMLLDADQKTMYVVDTKEKTVMDMSSILQGKSAPGKVKPSVTMQSRGKGPVIAGYATQHYQFLVNGTKCTDEYLSVQAMQDVESAEIFATMEQLGEMGMEVGAMANMDPCETVGLALQDIYGQYGFPLRIVDRYGSLDTEVLKIDTHATLPSGGFELPAGYPVKRFDEMMQQNMRDMEMPSMQDMPQDFDPAEFERRMQEMMKQMGRE